VAQRGEEHATVLKQRDGLQLDAISLRPCRGPPGLTGARSEIAGAFVQSDFQLGDVGNRD